LRNVKVLIMKAKKILCPVDFSPCSNVAFKHAVELARCSGAMLVLAHVAAPPPTYISGFAGYGALPPYDPEPDARLEKLESPDARVKVERVHLVGIEGEAVVKYAEQAGCDMIVMGTHGYGGITKFLLGSVAEYVMRHAKCPVVMIKDKSREQQSTDHSAATV
jgi:nucleotide-binding universal stress UspA family protein